MTPEIQSSVDYLQSRTQWQLANISALNERTWIARATTTHNSKQGEAEISFGVLAKGYDHITFSLDALPAMATWCQEQSKQ